MSNVIQQPLSKLILPVYYNLHQSPQLFPYSRIYLRGRKILWQIRRGSKIYYFRFTTR